VRKGGKMNDKMISQVYLELEEKDELINSILDSSYDGIMIIDKNGVILNASKAVNRITGLIPEKIVGKDIYDLIRKGVLPKNSVSARVFKTETRMSTLLELKETVILSTATPYFDSQGNIMYVICNVRNITELEALRSKLGDSIYDGEFDTDFVYLTKQLSKIKKYRIEDFLVKSNNMINILKHIYSLKDYNLKYLISGETGTGKGLLAKIIHYIGKRKNGPFIEVNCSAIPVELFESELFGYKEGAFSGAQKKGQPGLLESANTGTVLLDEIGSMPLQIQSKLLKFLDDAKIKRLGSPHSIDIDVQIISATNKDLKKEIQSEKFRKDLYFRINEIAIEIPPLRDRLEDIIYMLNYFWKKYCTLFDRNLVLKDEALQYLKNYTYPGNVRELKNIVKNLVLKAKTNSVGPENFPVDILSDNRDALLNWATLLEESSLPQILNSFEKDIIANTYKKFGSTYKAAEALGINQSTFYRRAKKYGLLDSKYSETQI
jgi:PAS domain S-box-containing protein